MSLSLTLTKTSTIVHMRTPMARPSVAQKTPLHAARSSRSVTSSVSNKCVNVLTSCYGSHMIHDVWQTAALLVAKHK